METPKFELGKSRYNLDTFTGRFYQNMDIIDPRTLFVSEAKLNESIKLLDDFKSGKLNANVTDQQLWDAQKIKQSTLHPDTGEKIFMPFRMSGYVPFNSPILAGLLMPNPTMAQTIFWQWLNQSHNACVNYANRNATKPTQMSTFLTGYGGAVTAAITISVGLNLLLRRANNLKPSVRNMIQRFVPLPAVATASTLNVVLMRMHEIDEGIDVVDKSGQVVGTSKLAAKKALQEMAVTRAALPIPLLTIPPVIMTMLEKTPLLKKYPRSNILFNLIVCSITFFYALPATIAIFPQMSEVNVKDLEPEIQKAAKEPHVYYNKGL
jgi:sideroflexin-5